MINGMTKEMTNATMVGNAKIGKYFFNDLFIIFHHTLLKG